MKCAYCQTPMLDKLHDVWCCEKCFPDRFVIASKPTPEEMRQRARSVSIHNGMTDLWLQQTWANCDWQRQAHNQEALKDAMRWLPGRSNAYFYGKVGTGKTWTAHAMLNTAIQHGYAVAPLKAHMILRIADCFGMVAAREFEQWQRVPVLLIDDVDKANWTERALVNFYGLLDARMEAQLSTIMTANVGPSELGEFFGRCSQGNSSLGWAITERMMPVLILEFTGKSLRGQKPWLNVEGF